MFIFSDFFFYALACVYVWICGLRLLCAESCCFENGGKGWIFSVLLVFPTSWTKKRCLSGQEGLLVVSSRLTVCTQLRILSCLSAFEVEEIDQWSTHFSPRRRCENTQSTIWTNKCFIDLVVLLFLGEEVGLCRQASLRRLQIRPKAEKRTDRLFNHNHPFFVWVWF